MKEAVPAFVFKHAACEKDWISEHDTLTTFGLTLPFNETNQEDWWLLNHKIRQAFDGIEKEVKSLIQAGSFPRKSIISWVQLAKRLDCDRANFTHPKRIQWTTKRRKAIEELIKNTKKNVEYKEEEITNAITSLQDRLDKQRSQTAHWFEKYKEKEAISNEMLTLLENKSIEIEELNRIIRALKNKTDTETKVIKLE